MAMQLVVVAPFGDHAVGDRITKSAEVERLADSPHVVRVDPDLTDTPAGTNPAAAARDPAARKEG